MQSAIHGEGWGSQHSWENLGTKQQKEPRDRCTVYVCSECGVEFSHYYHVIGNIFLAMEMWPVKEFCEPRLQEDEKDQRYYIEAAMSILEQIPREPFNEKISLAYDNLVLALEVTKE